KKISWIKWDIVCLPKKKGGLDVRDVRVVNISLLAKWHWQLLFDDEAVWKEVLKSKYGTRVVGRPELGEECKPWFASLWWKDICSIGCNLNHNWFSQCVIKILGNGMCTSFWWDTWAGEISLKDRFPRLFSISTQKDSSVAELRCPNSGLQVWSFVWRRGLFEWEQASLNELMESINMVSFSDADDRWGRRPEKGAAFTVKSTYRNVYSLSAPAFEVEPWHASIFNAIWKSPAPSKVSGFVWQLLHSRVPTRNNLVTRRILDVGGDSSYALCGEEMETELHLFLYCEIALLVWMEIFSWLDVPFCLPHNLFSIFNCLLGAGDYKIRYGMIMICNSVVWTLWRCRNSILFDNGRGTVADLVEAIKVSTWKWWMSRATTSHCLLYEWCVEPRLCLLR
ncbi:putative non-LTR retroelement reverse transcriptase, partial [Trifolium medium]|nr:putative non-LTR retroelement reverse transcriptase [Trifolium medium]MCH90246.1 putative non-LTR retroelement reverse transcriptase [Trifolium medium]